MFEQGELPVIEKPRTDHIPGSKSKYTIYEFPDGFLVEGKDRNPVRVRFGSLCMHVVYDIPQSDDDLLEISDNGLNHERFGFYDYYSFSDSIARGLMAGWEPPEDHERKAWPGLANWARKQTARALGPRIHRQWKRLLANVDTDVLAVQRAIFAATFGSADLAMCPDLYKHRYLVSDIINYRAAAIALRNVDMLTVPLRERQLKASALAHEATTKVEQLQAFAESLGVMLSVNMSFTHAGSLPVDEQINYLKDWRSLFSPTGEDYRSLNRTLMNLPGGLPHELVCSLAYVYLRRPIFERMELATFLIYVEQSDVRGLHNEDVFMFARAPDIKLAMARVAEHTRNVLSHRRTYDIKLLVRFLMDYPEDHNGNIVGLADRSIRWHREFQAEQIQRTVNQLGEDTKTESPPIPLPELPEVQFLATVGDIVDEAQRMEHCVASYAAQAVRGYCYLFHVQRNGDQATIEVDRQGRVAQALGPRNRRNGGARWAQRVLGQWGAQFPELPPPGHDPLPAARPVEEGVPF